MGIQKKMSKMEMEAEKKNKIIPVSFALNVEENMDNAELLKKSVIAENAEVLELSQIHDKIKACHVEVSKILSLSPTKLLIVFENEIDVECAVNVESPLWNIFDDVRIWSEGEYFDDRLVWIECVGIHPLLWSEENVKLIGQKWGEVIHIENHLQGVDTITRARIQVRTKAQNRIDNRIRFFSNHVSCEVWVKEVYGNDGGSRHKPINMTQTHANIDGKQYEVISKRGQSIQPIGPPDPLVQDRIYNMVNSDTHDWVDPIVENENISWKLAENIRSFVEQGTQDYTPETVSRPSRPRGRPKRTYHHDITSSSQSQGMLEINKTWEVAQMLGITSQNVEAVVSGLRKSKRILLLEGRET